MYGMRVKEIQKIDIFHIAEGFSETAYRHQLQLFTCCEPIDLSQYGVAHASCIDAIMIENILGCSIRSQKDASQRPNCGCIQSVEIGAYDSCAHGCKYCYANSSPDIVQNNMKSHNAKAPILFGSLPERRIITKREMFSVKDKQIRLF